jgi:hypothetical protein
MHLVGMQFTKIAVDVLCWKMRTLSRKNGRRRMPFGRLQVLPRVRCPGSQDQDHAPSSQETSGCQQSMNAFGFYFCECQHSRVWISCGIQLLKEDIFALVIGVPL